MQEMSSIFRFMRTTLTQFAASRKRSAVTVFAATFAAVLAAGVLVMACAEMGLVLYSDANWSAGWQAWKANDHEGALKEWSKGGIMTDFSLRPARAYYWRIRALDELGREKEATVLRAEVARKFPFDYYAFLLFPDGGASAYPSGIYGKIAKMLYPCPWSAEVYSAASKTGVQEELLWAIMRRESKFRKFAMSGAGAVGLMQLMPSTASETAARIRPGQVNVDISQPDLNILLGASYMEQLTKKFPGELQRALAAYNAGASNVVKWDILAARDWVEWIEEIPYAETREYVRSVLENMEVYRVINGRPDPNGLMWRLSAHPSSPLAHRVSASQRKEN